MVTAAFCRRRAVCAAQLDLQQNCKEKRPIEYCNNRAAHVAKESYSTEFYLADAANAVCKTA